MTGSNYKMTLSKQIENGLARLQKPNYFLKKLFDYQRNLFFYGKNF